MMEKIDLRKFTTKEFAEMVNVNLDAIRDLMRNCLHLGYTNTPYENIVKEVQKTNLAESKHEVVADFLYTSIYNNSEHRFYNGRGWGITLRG